MTIPLEIRKIIYELSLVTNETIYPCVLPHHEADGIVPYRKSQYKLAMSLLAVNKQIQEESKEILYGHNRFDVIKCNGDGTIMGMVWQINAELLRHLEVSFNVRDLDQKEVLEDMHELFTSMSSKTDCFTHRRAHVYKHLMVYLAKAWVMKIFILSFTLSKIIELDATNSYCPHFCCYQGEQIVNLVKCDMKVKQNEMSGGENIADAKIRFKGLWGEKGWMKIHAYGFRCELCTFATKPSDPKKCDWKAKGLHGHSIHVPYYP